MAVLRLGRDVRVRDLKEDIRLDSAIQELSLSVEQIEKGGYDHFMLKEIYEQPRAILDTFRGRLLPSEGLIKLSGLDNYLSRFIQADRIIIVACGTSWHAGLVA